MTTDAYWIAKILFEDPSVRAGFVVGCLVLAPLSGWAARRRSWSGGRALAAGLAGVGLSGMFAVTLARWIEFHPDFRWRGCTTGSGLTVTDGEALLNVLVLMPAAFFAMLAVQRFLVVAVAATLVTVAVETVQSLASLGTCQTSDVVRNSGGALVAAAVAACLLGLASVGRRLRPAAR